MDGTMSERPLVSKKGYNGYAFYSDRVVINKNNNTATREISYAEIDHLIYCSRFNFVDTLTLFAFSSTTYVPPLHKDTMDIFLKDDGQYVRLRLAPHHFEMIKKIVNVPVRVDYEPQLEPGATAYRARHGKGFYSMLAITIAFITIASVVVLLYDAVFLLLVAMFAMLPITLTVGVGAEDSGRYVMNNESVLINSALWYEKMDYSSIRSVNIVYSERPRRNTPSVKHVIITFNKKCGRNVYRDTDVKLIPYDTGLFVSDLKAKIPGIRIIGTIPPCRPKAETEDPVISDSDPRLHVAPNRPGTKTKDSINSSNSRPYATSNGRISSTNETRSVERNAELQHSLWILWTFTGFLNFVAFFFVGFAAKVKRWVIAGFVYLAAVVTSLAIFIADADIEFHSDFLLSDIILGTFWAISIVHAFAIRRTYLVRIGILEDVPKRKRNLRRTKKVDVPTGPLRPDIVTPEIEYPIDLNKCTEHEFTYLPGISAVRAKRAVMIRSEKEGFDSVDDFIGSLKIEPHFAVQIREKTVVSKFIMTPIPPSKGRKLDI